jgi:hypothetical protein
MVNKDFLAAKLRKQIGLEYEDYLVWLKETPLVGEKVVVSKSRISKPSGKWVGYSVLVSGSPNNGASGCFNRRVFFDDPNGVSPKSLFPGVSLDKCR